MEDPRIERRKLHLLEDIVFISIAAVLSGAETWDAIALYGKQKRKWLESVLKLPNGIPSHDTFNRFFSALSPDSFNACFINWVHAISDSTAGRVVAIDGKSIRGAKTSGVKSLVHIVSAWCNENQMTLGQLKVDQKSNEITAIPSLLSALMLEGSIVTIDAMGCQKDIAADIIAAGADYILAVKGNQEALFKDILSSFSLLKPDDAFISDDFGHGRIEQRSCFLIRNLKYIEQSSKWKDIKSIIKIDSLRVIKKTGQEQRETRFYISSLGLNAEKIAKSIREHWGGNNLHWTLDVSFSEDASRKRAGNTAENFSTLTRIALNILKQSKDKISIKNKRFKAALNNQYLANLLKF